MNDNSKPSPSVQILIVEDSTTQRELLRHTLEQHGYQVCSAANGAEALELLRTNSPASVLSDIVMPEIDGYELCRRIKSDPRLQEIPVLLLTALSDPKDVIEGLECGADNFIVKPFDESYLLSRLEYTLSNRPLSERERPGSGVEILFAGRRYLINSRRRQILDLLLSTYEAAVRKNSELEKTREELKMANAELEQRVRERTAKLEETNQSLESFTYTIAHDLRSPLRAIHGYTSILLDRYGATYDEDAKELSQRVVASARQMDTLIQDLLAYGRMAQADLPRGRVSLESGVDTVLQQLRPEIQSRHAEIQVDRPLPEIQGNALVLEQVLVNLLSNALKFSKDNVSPRVRIWAETPQPGMVRVHVKDNGIGIDPAHAHRIFGVFQRLHDARKYPGTGIGLVIVRKGVERMGGKVGVESRLGEGACFWLELLRAT